MLGQNFVVFRDSEGNPNTLHDICIHRGASLSEGLIKKDCIQCPYHGWQFDGKGECKKIPSLGKDAKIPKRAKIDAYPTEEKYGIVFAFLGELPKSQRPPIMPIEELDDEGVGGKLLNLRGENQLRTFNRERSGCNTHEFVHPTHGHEGRRRHKVNELN